MALASLILVAALVVDVANWYVHKRHLQTQADAAAFAGGAELKLLGCNNDAIHKAVQQYSGVKSEPLGVLNPDNVQVGKRANVDVDFVHILVNSPDPDGYWSNGYTSDGPEPCAARHIDVKMTEEDLPWFLRIPFLVPAINAHARVEMRLVSNLKGQLPIGVVDVNPQSGAVIFYDEANPGNLSTTYARQLRKINTAGGLNEWANVDSSGSATPVSVTMPPSGRLGSVVAFSSDGPPKSAPMSISGTVSEICGRLRVDCYNDPASSGLLFVHGFQPGLAPNKTPVVKGATLSTSNCPDSYGYFTYNEAACSATLSVTFGTTITTLDNVELTAAVGGNCSGGGHDSSATPYPHLHDQHPRSCRPMPHHRNLDREARNELSLGTVATGNHMRQCLQQQQRLQRLVRHRAARLRRRRGPLWSGPDGAPPQHGKLVRNAVAAQAPLATDRLATPSRSAKPTAWRSTCN